MSIIGYGLASYTFTVFHVTSKERFVLSRDGLAAMIVMCT